MRDSDEMKQVLAIPPDILDVWEAFLLCEKIPYGSEGWDENSPVWTGTARFEDGIEMDVDVVSGREEDGDCFARAYLYSTDGNRFVKIGESETRKTLRGEWTISVSGPEGKERVYSVSVENWKNPVKNG